MLIETRTQPLKKIYSFPIFISALALSFCADAVNESDTVAADEVLNTAESNLEVITISSTGSMRTINEVAANVTAISSKQIDQLAATNIRDMLRYEPGISVEGSGRFGLAGFNIRGINGDRILMLLDGVPIADEFSFGPNLSSRRDFIDIDLLKSVEIIRGPASTLYGSDAIGGVVSFISKDPIDILLEEQSLGGRVKLGYASQAEETNLSAQLAAKSGNWQMLVAGGLRDASETGTFYDDDAIGAERKSADPQANDAKNALIKLIYSPNEHHRVSISGDYFDQSSDTDLLSAVGVAVRGSLTLSDKGIDTRSRERLSVNYSYTPTQNNALNLYRLNLNTFIQQSETKQESLTQRQSLNPMAPIVTDRERMSFFFQDIWGVRLQADHTFGDSIKHYLIYGVESTVTDSESLRTSINTDIATGEIQPEFSIFPARDFPISELKEHAFFIQNEIELMDGALRLSPGFRYDTFKLSPSSDPIFANANPGVDIVEFDDSELSAKLGAVYQVSSDVNVWAQYSEGFRIPPMDDVNIGFTNFAGGYTSLANPDLKPESAKSYELGARGSFDALDWSVSAYYNDYTNFIESLSMVGFNPMTRLIEFQAINIEDVEIQGVDLSATWYMGETIYALDGFTLHFASSTQQSEDKATGQELESILPTQTVVGLQYGSFDDKWQAELITTFTGQANSTLNDEGVEFFRADSYQLFDFIMHYQFNDAVRVNAGIFNITDEKYFQASEVRGQPKDADLSRLSATGRNFSANLVVNF